MIRVLLVDDSPLARRLIARVLNVSSGFEVVGEASDPYAARDRIIALRPDVTILDLEMPRMDGISFLRRLAHYFPVKVVVCSSLTREGGDTALCALEAGAFAVVNKPTDAESVPQMAAELVAVVRAAASASSRASAGNSRSSLPAPLNPSQWHPSRLEPARSACQLVAIGASTGGTVAVETVARALPPDSAPVVIVQHLPPYITEAFARRLDRVCALSVEEASDGRVLERGVALVAPGGKHMTIERRGTELCVSLRDGAKLNGHRPSVDVLFHAVAEAASAQAIGVLLTGMGRDGANGLLAMRTAGAFTVAQDEASSVVWGMPKAAIDIGAADEVLALERVAARLRQLMLRGATPHGAAPAFAPPR